MQNSARKDPANENLDHPTRLVTLARLSLKQFLLPNPKNIGCPTHHSKKNLIVSTYGEIAVPGRVEVDRLMSQLM
jgi:hypothetical protein